MGRFGPRWHAAGANGPDASRRALVRLEPGRYPPAVPRWKVVAVLLALLQANAAVLDPDANSIPLKPRQPDRRRAGRSRPGHPGTVPGGLRAAARIRSGLDPDILPALRQRLAGIARRHGIALVYSLPRLTAQGEWQISATLLDAQGASLLEYGKVHLFGDRTSGRPSAPPTQPPAVVDFHGIPTSMVICYDVEFPGNRPGRGLARSRTAPGSHGAGPRLRRRTPGAAPRPGAGKPADHRLREPFRRRGRLRFLGGSVVAGPDGKLLAAAGAGATVLFAEVDPAAAARGSGPRCRTWPSVARTCTGLGLTSTGGVHELQRNP